MKNCFKKYPYITSVIVILIIILAWFHLITDGEYGITLFLTIPGTIGLIWGYNTEYDKNHASKKIALNLFLVLLGLSAVSGLLIMIGAEGAICILMAMPFIFIPLYVMFLIGMIAGYYDRKKTLNSILIFIFFVNPASYIFDSYIKPIQDTVTTEIIVNSSQENVWKLLSSEILFNDPEFILFEKGVSYPKSIELINTNGKMMYQCKTNNDKINLNIDEFVKNKTVKFSLANQTVPMKEMTPYEDIDAKHLHDYFIVDYGQISLEKITENKTKIIAKTQYSYRIAPKWYWKKWSNYILDRMQYQVLNSIKTQSEND
ncbi:hypothetical protein [Chryseobacterium taiwanense]|uniref:Uncharacterized protein n=1 Tax=Chryseobacterium taiwanense TaxID=363331 RepID=A0A0B4DH17_9FLAO|nr:hypothetical protein [Chryseobacterium taiwanense]KIC63730.1 hypothetical protein RM51_08755 [Chryseobacterium taiwanense]